MLAVTANDVLALASEMEHTLHDIPVDYPGRDALDASLADLRVLHKSLTETKGKQAGRLEASRATIVEAHRVLRDNDR